MGKRLLDQGFTLMVAPHRNTVPAEELAKLGASVAAAPADLASSCNIVITCVPDAPEVEDALFGAAGLTAGKGRELLHVNMSTMAPSAERSLNRRLAEIGVSSIDAPVSGGPLRAADGTLTIMVGGRAEAVERALPVLEKLGKHVVHVGESGAGQVVKLANQLMISIIMLANAEALSLGVRAGVPLETLVEVIGTSSGSNYLMQNWLPKTLFSGDLEGGFALDLLLKDVRAALRSAEELGVPVFGGALAEQLYKLTRVEQGGRLDYSAVARLYEQAAGVELRFSKNG
jgi:3-hydroxyisobutyrate dehydrogenase-like beta-hydroxyacid dehydrogenase